MKKSKVSKKLISIVWIKCKYCKQTFLTETGMKIHIEKSHPFRNSLEKLEEGEETKLSKNVNKDLVQTGDETIEDFTQNEDSSQNENSTQKSPKEKHVEKTSKGKK